MVDYAAEIKRNGGITRCETIERCGQSGLPSFGVQPLQMGGQYALPHTAQGL